MLAFSILQPTPFDSLALHRRYSCEQEKVVSATYDRRRDTLGRTLLRSCMCRACVPGQSIHAPNHADISFQTPPPPPPFAGSFTETLAGWAEAVVTGRARLGGIPVGIVATEGRLREKKCPADPADVSSHERIVQQVGWDGVGWSVWRVRSLFLCSDFSLSLHEGC